MTQPEHRDYSVPRALADGAVGLPTEELVAADPLRRFGGWLIDLGVLALALAAGVGAAIAVTSSVLESSPALIAASAVVFSALGGQWLMTGWRGQTLGKLLCRVKLVSRDGRPCGFVRGVLLRSVIPLLVVIVVWRLAGRMELDPTPVNMVILGGFVAEKLMVFSADGRRLVDRIAGTRVVAVDPLPAD